MFYAFADAEFPDGLYNVSTLQLARKSNQLTERGMG